MCACVCVRTVCVYIYVMHVTGEWDLFPTLCFKAGPTSFVVRCVLLPMLKVKYMV